MNLAVQISVDSSVVEYLPSKQVARVRFPVDAVIFFCLVSNEIKFLCKNLSKTPSVGIEPTTICLKGQRSTI